MRWPLAAALAVAAVSGAPSQRTDSRSCALCHLSWMPAFLDEGRNGELMALPESNVVNSADMCFSCHDGSVVDSRERVFLQHGHSTGVTPPEGMEIPEELPLDAGGDISCATCHTAHGTDMRRMDMANAVFLRVENRDSQMCAMCHGETMEGLGRRNHAVGVDLGGGWPEALAQSVATQGQSHQLVCQSCHAAHGSSDENLLALPMDQSQLCSACHTGHLPTGDLARPGNHPAVDNCTTCHRMHESESESALLFRDNRDDGLCLFCHTDMQVLAGSRHHLSETAPDLANASSLTPRQSGSCSGCHAVHHARGPLLWAREPAAGAAGDGALCLSCHAEDTGLGLPAIGDFSHPVGVSAASLGDTGGLPLFDDALRREAAGDVGCGTCHSVHETRLRRSNEGDALCLTCHGEQAEQLAGGHHDLGEAGGPCASCHAVHQAHGPGLAARPLAESDAPAHERVCRSCHGDADWPEAGSPDRHLHPLHSDDGDLRCASCHDPHRLPEGGPSTRLASAGDSPLCRDCHARQAEVVGSSHGRSSEDLCGTCHRFLDDDGSRRLFAAQASEDAVAGLCQTCHTVALHSHPRAVAPDASHRPDHLPLFSARGERGSDGVITCATCHNPHDGAASDFLRPAQEGDPALCVDCHHGRRAVAGTAHDLRQGVAGASLCAPCHRAHPPDDTGLLWGHDLGPGPDFVTQACTGCHREGGDARPLAPETTRHPSEAVILESPPGIPLYDIHGRSGGAGEITCATCHDVHRWTARADQDSGGEGTVLTSFTRPGVAEELCATCHGQEALVRYLLYHRGQRWGRPALVPWSGE